MARKFNISIGRITITDKALFTKHMAVMLKAGLTINDALDVAFEESTGRFSNILRDVKEKVLAGSTLADALSKYEKVFSNLYVNIIRVGEKSGTLVESLEQLAIQLEKENELRSKISQAMLYPIIVLAAVILVGGGISIFVLPKLTSLFQVFQGQLPLSTQILLYIVNILVKYGIYIFPGLIVLTFFLIWLTRTKLIKPIWHAILLKMPIVSPIVKNLSLAQFNRNFGTLLKSGLPATESLEIVADSMQNEVYRRKIKYISKEIQSGKNISDVISKMDKIFPKVTSKMINVGEKSGTLDTVLIFLAKFYESEVDKASKNLSVTLEPVLLVIIGFVVGFVVMAIITPIYSLTSTIGSQTP
ncbi:MAG: type II secretion system F family protein [Patescibacteria group bacterium]|jgi:type II secretory pathway component PulF